MSNNRPGSQHELSSKDQRMLFGSQEEGTTCADSSVVNEDEVKEMMLALELELAALEALARGQRGRIWDMACKDSASSAVVQRIISDILERREVLIMAKKPTTTEDTKLRAILSDLHTHVQTATEHPCANSVLRHIVDHCPAQFAEFIIRELRGREVLASKHRFGHTVIVQFVKRCSDTEGDWGGKRDTPKALIGEVLGSVDELLTHKVGHTVLQEVLEHSAIPEHKDLVVNAVLRNPIQVATDPYGSQVLEGALTPGRCSDAVRLRIGDGLLEAEKGQPEAFSYEIRDLLAQVRRVIVRNMAGEIVIEVAPVPSTVKALKDLIASQTGTPVLQQQLMKPSSAAVLQDEELLANERQEIQLVKDIDWTERRLVEDTLEELSENSLACATDDGTDLKDRLEQLTTDLRSSVEGMLGWQMHEDVVATKVALDALLHLEQCPHGQLPAKMVESINTLRDEKLVKVCLDAAYAAMLPAKAVAEQPEMASLSFTDLQLGSDKLAQGSFTWLRGTLAGKRRAMAVKVCKAAAKTKKGAARPEVAKKESPTAEKGDELQSLLDLHEADAFLQLSCKHPNVQGIIGVGRAHAAHPDALLVASPLVSLGSLKDILPSENQPVKAVHARMKHEPAVLADIFAGVSAALQHMHGQSPPVLHLNLKPANILITVLPGGILQPKLCDFLAVRPDLDAGASISTASTKRRRTLEAYRYMAPEQLRGIFGADAAPADVFTFAIVMAECITFNRFCEECRKAPEVVIHIVNEQRRPDLSNDVDRAAPYKVLLEGCWHEDASSRCTIQDATTVLREHWKTLRMPSGDEEAVADAETSEENYAANGQEDAEKETESEQENGEHVSGSRLPEAEGQAHCIEEMAREVDASVQLGATMDEDDWELVEARLSSGGHTREQVELASEHVVGPVTIGPMMALLPPPNYEPQVWGLDASLAVALEFENSALEALARGERGVILNMACRDSVSGALVQKVISNILRRRERLTNATQPTTAEDNKLQAILSDLHTHVRTALENPCANSVLQHIVEHCPPQCAQFVIPELLGKAADASKHRFGCRVIVRFVKRCADPEADWDEGAFYTPRTLIREVLGSADELLTDKYGNYVLQEVLRHSTIPEHKHLVAAAVLRNPLQVATDQHGCRVVEGALTPGQCSDADRRRIANLLLAQEGHCRQLVESRYGCFVLRLLLRLDDFKNPTSNLLRSLIPEMESSWYARRLRPLLTDVTNDDDDDDDEQQVGRASLPDSEEPPHADASIDQQLTVLLEEEEDAAIPGTEQPQDAARECAKRPLPIVPVMEEPPVLELEAPEVFEGFDKGQRGSIWDMVRRDSASCATVETVISNILRRREDLKKAKQPTAAEDNKLQAILSDLHTHVQTAIEHPYAFSVLRHIVEHCPAQFAEFVIRELRGREVLASKHCFGHKVIVQFVKRCADREADWGGKRDTPKALIGEVLGSVDEMLTHNFGHCVLREVLEHGLIKAHKELVANAVLRNAIQVAKDLYGCRVVEGVLTPGRVSDAVRHDIVSNLRVPEGDVENFTEGIRKLLAEDRGSSCVDGVVLRFSVCRRVSASCGARMSIPMATDKQMEAKGPGCRFTITSLPSEKLENGMVVSSVVHCTPEALPGLEFDEPVLLQLPLPHLDMSHGLEVVTREHGAKEWKLLLDKPAVRIERGMVCFSVSHFCEFGIIGKELDENAENWFTLIPLVQYCPEGLCDVRGLVFPKCCSKCDAEAKRMQKELQDEGWHRVGRSKDFKARDQWNVNISFQNGEMGDEADCLLAVANTCRYMTLPDVPVGSKVRLQLCDALGKQFQKEPLMQVPAETAQTSLVNGVVACGAGAALRYGRQSVAPPSREELQREQNSDEHDIIFRAQVKKAGSVELIDLFCDGLEPDLQSLKAMLDDKRPRFFVVHAHGIRDELGMPFGVGVYNYQALSRSEQRQLSVTYEQLAQVIQRHVESALSRLALVVVRSCYGYPLAKAASQLGIDAVSWIDGPRVDHANDFTMELIRVFQEQGGKGAREAFRAACQKQTWSIQGTVPELEAAKSVRFFAADPEVVVCELSPEGVAREADVSVVFEQTRWATWALDKGNVMMFKWSMNNLVESSRLTRARCILIIGSGQQDDVHMIPADPSSLSEVLSGIKLVVFSGCCSSLARAAHRRSPVNSPATILPYVQDMDFMKEAETLMGEAEVGASSILRKLWTVMYGPDGDDVKTLMDRLLEGGRGAAEESYKANRTKVWEHVEGWRAWRKLVPRPDPSPETQHP